MSGRMRPDMARRLGLPADLAILCGAHDSNACLARYLRAWPRATLVSSGTWAVIMSPGASHRALDARRDMLGNLSVRGEVVPTARFMAGREFRALCDGAAPTDATPEALDRVLQQDLMALPAFESQGGPFGALRGAVLRRGEPLVGARLADQLPADERAVLAALYCADVTAWLFERMGAAGPVVLEGPFASNPLLCEALAALLPDGALMASVDDIEGTVRGGWCLTRWTDPMPTAPKVRPVLPGPRAAAILARHQRWCLAAQRHEARHASDRPEAGALAG
jgi:L-fuculokinase